MQPSHYAGRTQQSSSKVSIRLLLLICFLLAALWAVFLLRTFSYETLPPSYPESASLLGAQLLSYTATEAEYRAAIGGLNYNNPALINSYSNSSDGSVIDNRKATDDTHTWFKLGDLLSAWNPDDVSPSKWQQSAAHPNKGNGLPRFDYSDAEAAAAALAMRQQELPFIVYNIPELNAAAEGAFSLQQLRTNLGDEVIDVERIPTNKYMYYKAARRKDIPSDWSPPQQDVSMTFARFLLEVQQSQQQPDLIDASRPLHYFTINARSVNYR